MCTVVLLRRAGAGWPLLLAANRDEMLARPWDPPAAWWPAQPRAVGGRDRDAGGTWMAVKDGVVAAVLNRPGSLGRAAGFRSRGELPLLAVAAGTAVAGVDAIAALDAGAWRPFNLVVADAEAAFFLRNERGGRVASLPLRAGVTMVTAHDPNDHASPRVARHLPRFHAAPPPDPDAEDWAVWEGLLASGGPPDDPAALRVPPNAGFGTSCSSLLAIRRDGTVRWRFAPGPAGAAPFAEVALPG